ncbi:MAG: acireductone synthase [Bacteroidota bacterium]
MIQFVLMDIEGTTTSISFVHEVLFPYASQKLPAFIEANAQDPLVQEELKSVKATVLAEQDNVINDEEAVVQLKAWIKEDRKHTALKSLQGYLWKQGYEQGEYQSHIYDDVVPVLQEWQAKGVRMGIYSSGSVGAQKLLFGYSEKGDLRPYLSAYFDTKIGHKREVESYLRIQQALDVPNGDILFLSDVAEELDAAKVAGFQVCQLVRPGTQASDRHPGVDSFVDLGSFIHA